jgi:hypothetical protein
VDARHHHVAAPARWQSAIVVLDTLLAAGRQRRPAAVCGHSIEVAIATLNQTSRGSRTIKCGRLKRSWIKTRLTIATGRQEPYRAPRQDNKPRAALLHCHASLGENVQVGHGNWQIADRKQRCRRWMGRCTTRHRQSICRRIDSDRGAATGPKVDVFHFRTEERHRPDPGKCFPTSCVMSEGNGRSRGRNAAQTGRTRTSNKWPAVEGFDFSTQLRLSRSAADI